MVSTIPRNCFEENASVIGKSRIVGHRCGPFWEARDVKAARRVCPSNSQLVQKCAGSVVAEPELSTGPRIAFSVAGRHGARLLQAVLIAISFVALGNYDKAFEYLEESFAERDNWFAVVWYRTEVGCDSEAIQDSPNCSVTRTIHWR
jgi:hypothetical protein